MEEHDADLREHLIVRAISNDSDGRNSGDRFLSNFPEELRLLPASSKTNLKIVRNRLREMGFEAEIILETLRKINPSLDYDRMFEAALNEVLTLQLIASEQNPVPIFIGNPQQLGSSPPEHSENPPFISLDLTMNRPRVESQINRPRVDSGFTRVRADSLSVRPKSSSFERPRTDSRHQPYIIKSPASLSQEERKDDRDDASEHFECPICCNEVPMNHFKYFSMPDCDHKFCAECMNDYLHNSIFSNQVLKISCPSENCKTELREEFIRKIITEDMFKKYKTFRQNQIINLDPNNRWCIRTGCNKYQKGSKENPEIICECGQHYCFLCQSEWHQGKSCEDAVDEDFQKYVLTAKAKQCQFCHSRIEKNGGCNHMTCTNCKREFCWICLKQYNHKHYLWWNVRGCPGMQFTEGAIHNRYLYCIKHLLKKVAEIIYYCFLLILLSPVAILVYFLFVLWAPLVFYHANSRGSSCSCCRILIYLILFIIGPCVSPLSFILSPYLICKIRDDY